jgi:hypothetical protein
MFSPDSPPPLKYHHVKPPSPKREEAWLWVKRILQVLFIIIGVGAIVGIILFGPKGKKLVCDRNMQVGASLISFGSCTEQ